MAPDVPHRPSTPAPERRVTQVHVEIGATIKDARRRRRWGIRTLAGKAALSYGIVQRIETGGPASLTAYARLAQALGLELQVAMVDQRRATTLRQDADLLHATLGELETQLLVPYGRPVGIDEPWQHYHFAGRADLVTWDLERQALLHIENKTRLPDVQDAIGRFKSTQAYLGRALWERLGMPGRPRAETHVMVALWSTEVLRVVRRQPSVFRSTFPDAPDALEAWLRGDPPAHGTTSAFVVLDPFANGRQRRMIGLDAVLGKARPRMAGYAEAATRLRQSGKWLTGLSVRTLRDGRSRSVTGREIHGEVHAHPISPRPLGAAPGATSDRPSWSIVLSGAPLRDDAPARAVGSATGPGMDHRS